MNDPPRLANLGGAPTARSLEQRWVLASQGVLTELFGASHARMGGLPRPLGSHFAALFLRRDWDVRHAGEALSRVEWLLGEGHRLDYAARTDRHADEFLAWDLVRAAAVAGWAYAAYHLSLCEAWSWMVRASRELQRTFDGWDDVGASYVEGCRLWDEEAGDQVEGLVQALLAPGGGWDSALAGRPRGRPGSGGRAAPRARRRRGGRPRRSPDHRRRARRL